MMPKDPYDQFQEVAVQSFADYEAEKQLIGSILRKGDLFDEVIATLSADMFHSQGYKAIFQAMQAVREHGLVLDTVTVGDQLDRTGQLQMVQDEGFAGRFALSKIREVGNPKSAMSYVDIVRDHWAKRQIDNIAAQLVGQSRAGRRASDILADAHTMFDELDMSSGKVSSRTYGPKAMASAVTDHAESASKGMLKGCPSGYPDLDRIVTMLAGDLILIAGRPGQGKSSLLHSVALRAARRERKRVGLFSLEMSMKQVVARLACQISEVPSDKILRGKLSPEEWTKFYDAVSEIERLPMAINDQSALTIPQLRTEARRIARDLGGLDLLVVDYTQLMRATRKVKNRNEEVGEITKGLKEIGRELDVPILAAAQMNRAAEQRKGRPVLSDLRESGDLENDSDVVMFIYQPSEVETDDARELIIAKHRNGPVGMVNLYFNRPLAKFESASVRIENLGGRK